LFDNSPRLFEEYCRYQRERADLEFNENRAEEVGKRLVQLNRLLGTIAALDSESRQLNAHITQYARHEEGPEPTPAMFHRMSEIGFDIEMLAEAFYYLAFRLRDVVKLLPGLKKYEAIGVRDVRNHLIAHPKVAVSNSFAHGSSNGPVLKAIRSDEHKGMPVDRGLYVNAVEMRDELERRLVMAVKSE
jgi:hypothetical protein